MARPLQKKKNKSSLSRIRQKPKSKRISIKSNPIVAANWDKTLTLSQNYRRLGLSSKLNASTGGTEVKTPAQPFSLSRSQAPSEKDALAIPSSKARKLEVGSVRVVRDPKTGAITGVVRDDEEERKRKRNPLVDPLNDLSDSESDSRSPRDDRAGDRTTTARGIVPELEAASRLERPKRPRKQSQRERDWIARLVGRYGEDFETMARDKKLNPMQQSEGDLRRRVGVWTREGEVEV